MSAKYMGLAVFIWVIVGLVGTVLEGAVIGPGEEGTLNGVLSWAQIFTEQDYGVLEIPGAIGQFFSSAWDIMTLNLAIFEGPYELARWILLTPLIAVMVFGMVIMFFGMLRRPA